MVNARERLLFFYKELHLRYVKSSLSNQQFLSKNSMRDTPWKKILDYNGRSSPEQIEINGPEVTSLQRETVSSKISFTSNKMTRNSPEKSSNGNYFQQHGQTSISNRSERQIPLKSDEESKQNIG